MTEDTLEEEDNEDKKQLVLWYVDWVLPAFAGKLYYGEDIRRYKLLTDKVLINGVEKVNVTIASEAYGLLIWESCEVKWLHQCQYKKKYGKKAAFPKAKEEKDLDGNGIAYYAGKYTDPMGGQLPLGGITDAGITEYTKYVDVVKGWRAGTEIKEFHKYLLNLIREEHQCTEESAEAERAKKNKRKRRPTKAVRAPREKKITRLDE